MKVVYSHQAQQDLFDIHDYIQRELFAPRAAAHAAKEIMAVVKGLDTLPERYPCYGVEPWHSFGIRFIPVLHYLVFYIVNESSETVAILRIMYSGRNVEEQLEQLDLGLQP